MLFLGKSSNYLFKVYIFFNLTKFDPIYILFSPQDHKGNKTSEEQAKETDDQQLNKQKDDQNMDKNLPNTGHKEDTTQTVGIVLLLAGLLSILATKRKKHY
ncbi:LPXTG cell wall anchor domain-containing protein [Bacillus sp. SH5-2]|nr:LPXTG cell wall anchor domain-containing protein [Bacillus sp. SH5-2]